MGESQASQRSDYSLAPDPGWDWEADIEEESEVKEEKKVKRENIYPYLSEKIYFFPALRAKRKYVYDNQNENLVKVFTARIEEVVNNPFNFAFGKMCVGLLEEVTAINNFHSGDLDVERMYAYLNTIIAELNLMQEIQGVEFGFGQQIRLLIKIVHMLQQDVFLYGQELIRFGPPFDRKKLIDILTMRPGTTGVVLLDQLCAGRTEELRQLDIQILLLYTLLLKLHGKEIDPTAPEEEGKVEEEYEEEEESEEEDTKKSKKKAKPERTRQYKDNTPTLQSYAPSRDRILSALKRQELTVKEFLSKFLDLLHYDVLMQGPHNVTHREKTGPRSVKDLMKKETLHMEDLFRARAKAMVKLLRYYVRANYVPRDPGALVRGITVDTRMNPDDRTFIHGLIGQYIQMLHIDDPNGIGEINKNGDEEAFLRRLLAESRGEEEPRMAGIIEFLGRVKI